mmetsp:Transcript_1891/g.2842  ORF Transcript_1891/g.2842 Transcript_1891/m.2842 type:complete len:86 (-) Transcript_1891:495-752(-)
MVCIQHQLVNEYLPNKERIEMSFIPLFMLFIYVGVALQISQLVFFGEVPSLVEIQPFLVALNLEVPLYHSLLLEMFQDQHQSIHQ